MFTEERPSFQGRYSSIDRALNEPRPIQPGGPPILVGGGGEQRTLKIAARFASMTHWFAMGLPGLQHKTEVLARHCEAIGRDPGEIERSAGVGDKSPEDIGKSLLDVGTRLFTVSSSGPDYDLGLLREWVSWRDEVNAK